MEKLKNSNYNLYVKVNNNYTSIINLLSGSMDIVNNNMIKSLKGHKINNLNENVFKYFKERNYITNLSFEEEKKKYIQRGKEIYEISKKTLEIIVPITYECNFICDYCFFWGKGAKKETRNEIANKQTKILTVKNVDKIVDFIIRGNYSQIILKFFGGEPLLEKNKDILKYFIDKLVNNSFQNKKINISFTTNGYNIDKFINLFEKILESNIKLDLQITIDGPKETHNTRRKFKFNNEGSFDKIISNIDLILELKLNINIILRSNIDIENINEIEKLYYFYKDKSYFSHKNINIYFSPVYTMDPKDKNEAKKITSIKYHHIMNLIKKNNYEEKFISLLFNMVLRAGRGIKYDETSKTLIFPFSSFTCGACSNMYVFDLDGNIYPCEDLLTQEKYSIGEYKNKIIFYDDKLNLWHKRTIFNIEKCRDCIYGLVCHGGFCPAYSLSVYNDLNHVECTQFPLIFKQYIKFISKKFLERNQNE